MAANTIGKWGKEAHLTFSRLASHLAISMSSPKPSILADIYSRLNIILVRSIARAILARECPPDSMCVCCSFNYVFSNIMLFIIIFITFLEDVFQLQLFIIHLLMPVQPLLVLCLWRPLLVLCLWRPLLVLCLWRPLLVLCLWRPLLVLCLWRPGSNYCYCLNVACHQPSAMVDITCQLTSRCSVTLGLRGLFGVLWRLALYHSKVGSAMRSCNKSLRPRLGMRFH